MPLARWRCSFGGGWACPPPMPPCPRYARAQARGLFNYSCGGWFAPFRRGADLRGVLRAGAPAPRLCGSGGPRPFSPSPLPTVAPRRGRRGFASLRESGARYARGFFFGYRVGGGGGGWGRLTRPLRPRRQGCARSRAPLPPRPLRPRPSSAWRALRDPPASVGRVRAAAATPIACALLAIECLGSPKKTAYATGFPLPTSAEPVFFGNPPCDIRHRD